MSTLNTILVGIERSHPKNAEEAKAQLLVMLDKRPDLAPLVREAAATVARQFGQPPSRLPVLCDLTKILDEWEAAR